jgi:heme-degrading monooxygenase HmoA
VFWDHILEAFRERVESIPVGETQLRPVEQDMSYAFVVFHYPRPDYRHDLLMRMQEMAELMAKVPGFIDAGQWAEEEGDCMAAISTWESKEACVAASDKAAASAIPFQYDERWESRPRQRFGFVRVSIPGQARA